MFLGPFPSLGVLPAGQQTPQKKHKKNKKKVPGLSCSQGMHVCILLQSRHEIGPPSIHGATVSGVEGDWNRAFPSQEWGVVRAETGDQ